MEKILEGGLSYRWKTHGVLEVRTLVKTRGVLEVRTLVRCYSGDLHSRSSSTLSVG